MKTCAFLQNVYFKNCNFKITRKEENVLLLHKYAPSAVSSISDHCVLPPLPDYITFSRTPMCLQKN